MGIPRWRLFSRILLIMFTDTACTGISAASIRTDRAGSALLILVGCSLLVMAQERVGSASWPTLQLLPFW